MTILEVMVWDHHYVCLRAMTFAASANITRFASFFILIELSVLIEPMILKLEKITGLKVKYLFEKISTWLKQKHL